MPRIANTKIDVFRVIDMTGGNNACWPFTGKTNNKNRPWFTAEGKKYLAYRLTYELVNGEGSLEGLLARHSCDNEICCNPRHIEPGSHQENMDDMKGRERHGLPHHTVRAIRRLGDLGINHSAIADRFGIARSTVSEMVERKTYQHVLQEGEDDGRSEEVNGESGEGSSS
jgi:hypothetical protein